MYAKACTYQCAQCMSVSRALMSRSVCFHYARSCVWLNVAEFPLKVHNGLSDQLCGIRNRNTKHLFTHLAPFTSLSRSAPLLFCFLLSLAHNSISLSPSSSIHINKWVIGWNVVVRCFSHSFFIGSMKEHHGFKKKGKMRTIK